MHTVGLAGGAGIRQHLRVVVEDEAVARIGSGVDVGPPPAVVATGHRVQRAVDVEANPSGCGAQTANSAIDALQQRDRQLARTGRRPALAAEPAAGDAVGPHTVGQSQRRITPTGFSEDHTV